MLFASLITIHAVDCTVAPVFPKPEHENTLRVTSWNIVADFFDNKDKTSDGRHKWPNRRGAIFDTIAKIQPDILGLQELSPEMADDIASSLKEQYDTHFLSQTPSEIPTGEIISGHEVRNWIGKFIGTPLVGFAIKKGALTCVNQGRFWLNENPDEVPVNKDRGQTDKGFGNMNTYRAVHWVELKKSDQPENIFAFNTHYPLDGTNDTRRQCAAVERKKIDEITRGRPWVSMGDRNTIPPEGSASDISAMQPLLEGNHNAVADNHTGPQTTFAGFWYDLWLNKITPEGQFERPQILDVMISNLPSIQSLHGIPQFNPETKEVTINPPVLGEDRYFPSDHLLVAADYRFNKA